jgi:hypothetical protein
VSYKCKVCGGPVSPGYGHLRSIWLHDNADINHAAEVEDDEQPEAPESTHPALTTSYDERD